MNPAMRSYLAEFLGTFTLVLVGTSVATLQGFIPGHTGTGFLEISFAFGFTLMVLVVGPVSGCHIKPAVTIPKAISGRLPWSQVPGYIISQFGGALVASIVLLALLKGIPTYEKATMGLGANGNPQEMKIGGLFAWEVIITALFLFTIFSVTRPDSPTGFAALAIGGFLFVAHLIGAEVRGFLPESGQKLRPGSRLRRRIPQDPVALYRRPDCRRYPEDGVLQGNI